VVAYFKAATNLSQKEGNVMQRIAVFLLLVLSAAGALSQVPGAPGEPRLSPAERNMAQARRLIEKNPKDFEAYNALALALSRRARETSDVKFYAQAEEALQKSFEASPDNFDGRRIQVGLLLGRHEFAAAPPQPALDPHLSRGIR
jgi:tetratricopeptide (TPR) repeat protein